MPMLLFSGYDASGNIGLWVTGGTAAGTYELTGITNAYGGGNGVFPFNITAFNGEALFAGEDASGVFGLWATDGTAAGTHELTGINGAYSFGLFTGGLLPTNPSLNNSSLNPDFTVFNGEVLFAGLSAGGLTELWRTDGTGAGTYQLNISGENWDGLTPQGMIAFNGEVLFAGTDGAGNRNLWVTDGTAAGTHELIGTTRTGGLFSWNGPTPPDFTIFNGNVLFVGKTPSNGARGVWVTDGTATGTHELTGIIGANANFVAGGSADFTVFNGEVLFDGNNSSNTASLWVTDGTATGTHELTGINGASGLFNPGNNPDFTVFNGEVLFEGYNTNGIFGLWVTDGTAGGTHELTNIVGANPSGLFTGIFPNFTGFNGEVLFNGLDSNGNEGLWVTDGTAAGTHELAINGAYAGGLFLNGLVPDFTLFNTAPHLIQVGNNYFLYRIGASSGPELSYNGAPVVAGEFGAYVPIAAEQTVSGYDLCWSLPGGNSFGVWALDTNGNFSSSLLAPTSGTNPALESLETIFQQDLNGDGTIGVRPTIIESKGVTDLAQIGSNYFLFAHGTTSGPELSFGSAPVAAGEFGAYVPIGAEQTASGYDLCWSLPGGDSFGVWALDSNGNFTSSLLAPTSGTSPALESLEPVFQQDLNQDGVIGLNLPMTMIASAGSTSLVQVGNNYFLYPIGGSSGPELSYNGAPVVAGQFGAYVPIAGEQTASGYDLCWSLPGGNSFGVWALDTNGNFSSSLLAPTSGTNPALESLEPVFHQDLNGDGLIGPPSIPAAGTLQAVSAYSGQVSFTASTGTLELLNSSSFAGTVAGMFGQDTIDFADIDPTKVQVPTYSGTAIGGTLTVTDGTHSANIALLGNYLASTFVASSDGHGGTNVIDPSPSALTHEVSLAPSHG